MLAYWLLQSDEVQPLRDLVNKRLLERGELEAAQRHLNQMLITLWAADYIGLDPKPVPLTAPPSNPILSAQAASNRKQTVQEIADGLFAAMTASKPKLPPTQDVSPKPNRFDLPISDSVEMAEDSARLELDEDSNDDVADEDGEEAIPAHSSSSLGNEDLDGMDLDESNDEVESDPAIRITVARDDPMGRGYEVADYVRIGRLLPNVLTCCCSFAV